MSDAHFMDKFADIQQMLDQVYSQLPESEIKDEKDEHDPKYLLACACCELEDIETWLMLRL